MEERFNETKAFFKEHSELIITNSDKGNITSVMEKTQYQEKMKNLIHDPKTYQCINQDPTERIQRVNNRLVKELYEAGHIRERERTNITSYNAVPPRIWNDNGIKSTLM